MTEKLKKCIEQMHIMYGWFEAQAKTNALYIPEHETISLIRKVTDYKESYTKEDFDIIKNLLFATDLVEHADGVHWLDYKIHLNYFLHQYGLTDGIY